MPLPAGAALSLCEPLLTLRNTCWEGVGTPGSLRAPLLLEVPLRTRLPLSVFLSCLPWLWPEKEGRLIGEVEALETREETGFGVLNFFSLINHFIFGHTAHRGISGFVLSLFLSLLLCGTACRISVPDQDRTRTTGGESRVLATGPPRELPGYPHFIKGWPGLERLVFI